MDLSFSGAGFMGCYYFGVVDCWNKYIPRERVNRVAGASAGSLIAAYFLMELPLSDCLREIIAMTEDIRRRPLGVFDRSNQIVDLLPQLLDRVFPDDAHKRVGDRLYVCMTRLKDMSKVMVNKFDSKQELIEALNCSCFIPVWSGNHVSTYKGVKHIDGGFSDNLPVFDENTIRICCFAGPTDISPMGSARSELIRSNVLNTPVYVNLANARRLKRALTPPPASYILDLLQRGFHDAKDFILSTDLIQCDQCYKRLSPGERQQWLPVRATLTPSASRVHSRQGSFRSPSAVAASLPTTSLPTMSSLSRQLQAKLRNYSPDSAFVSSSSLTATADANNNTVHQLVPPQVVVVVEAPPPPSSLEEGKDKRANSVQSYTSSASSSAYSSSSEGQPTNVAANYDDCDDLAAARSRNSSGGAAMLGERFQQRRASQLGTANQLLVIQDKFKSSLEPLPSCPPSPSLNRHCLRCISLRQEARNDLLEEQIRAGAESFIEPANGSERNSGAGCGLTSPLRWLKSLRTRHSYSFVANQPPTTN